VLEQHAARLEVGHQRASAVLKNCPPTSGSSGSNVPSGRTGLTTGSP
jgi:hypothetical protein